MVIQNIYQPFEIVYKKADTCPNAHQHNFFELVYIMGGTGKQCINKNKFDYHQGHFFLLTPQDCHSFDVETRSKFFFLRFHDVYLKTLREKDNYNWIQRLEFIFHNASHLPGCILKNNSDKLLVQAVVESILREKENEDIFHKELVQQLVNTLLTIVARNIAMNVPEKLKKKGTDEIALKMVGYLHQHIYNPEMLRAEQISSEFGISLNYLSEYFKKHTGETLQQYITNYKMRLVETRLQHSSMRISEIAYELNFTDESHLNKMFKKHKGVNPSDYRKSVVAN